MGFLLTLLKSDMKRLQKICVVILLTLVVNSAFAQNEDEARSLIKAGVALNDQGKYTDAIEKYQQALKADTGNLHANYQLAFSLFKLDRSKESIHYLEKVVKGNNSLNGPAYDLLGLCYFKNKQYNEAENAAIESLKINPKQAGTQRMYALVTFHQNKRAAALLGFCSFIILEPQTARSAEAFGNIQHILAGGSLKAELGVAINPLNADDNALNQAITKAVAEAAREKHATATDLLAAQIKNIFTAVGQLAEKKSGSDFFRNYMVAYFYKMAQSANMPAFARLVSQNTPESKAWIAAHGKEMDELNEWIKTTERGF
jgi:tetratricopeptide (TPR) repeat protein